MAVAPDIQQQVYDLLSRASNLSFVNVGHEEGARLTLVPGQRVTAQVLATLPNNRAQVQVGTQQFNLDLPMAVRQGQLLEMTFISEDPRSTFAIARQGGVTPPVSLSDASRLLGLLVGSEQITDPGLRSSLQSIGDMLRRSSGEAGVLANLMDEALTYGASLREAVKGAPQVSEDFLEQDRNALGTTLRQNQGALTPDQARLTAFETNATQILNNLARSSRFVLAESVNQPVTPLPLMPGDEVDAAVLGTLPGGRVFVQVAGTTMELLLPRAVQAGDILRLTYISSLPKPLFGLSRTSGEPTPGVLSEAGRWLSVMEHNEGGLSSQQMFVLERLNSVLKSLPPDSPAFTVIRDEALIYQNLLGRRPNPLNTANQIPQNPLLDETVFDNMQDDSGSAMAIRPSRQSQEQAGSTAIMAQQAMLQSGNGIVLSDDMAKLLQALIKGNRLALLEAINQQATPMGLSSGQQIKGEIIALLGGGRFMVSVAGRALEMSMPRGTQRGDLINLFFITEEPTPTFLMARFGLPGDSRVSDTGRWLSGFLGEASEKVSAQATLGLMRTLLADPPTNAGQVSQMLQQELRNSGLFYESHLARWFGGDYPLDDILREPQGQLSHLRQPMIAQVVAIAVDELARASMKAGSLEVLEAVVKKYGASSSHEGIADQRTLSMVREQLDTLQSGQIIFRGELFAGQQMEWRVRERESRRNSRGEMERTWDTELRLNLPKLGAINASVVLDGNRVGVDLHVEKAASVEILSNAKAMLAEQLETAGLNPMQIGVHHETP